MTLWDPYKEYPAVFDRARRAPWRALPERTLSAGNSVSPNSQ
jgi:hypothetical protein